MGVTCFLPREMQIIKALTGKPVCSLHSNLYQQMCCRVPVKASVKSFCNLKPMESELGIKNQMELPRKDSTHSGSTHSLKTAAVHMLYCLQWPGCLSPGSVRSTAGCLNQC